MGPWKTLEKNPGMLKLQYTHVHANNGMVYKIHGMYSVLTD
jgi:hypothetical protein